MFENNLYVIIHYEQPREEGKASLRIRLNPDHRIFEGHFPGNPVLPGVCLVQIIKESMETVTGQSLQLLQIQDIKFTQTINPGLVPELSLDISYTFEEESIKAKVLVSDEGLRFCVFNGSFLQIKSGSLHQA